MKHIFDWKEYARVARCAVAEGCVLIKNDQQVLPLKGGEKISIFGRSQLNYYKSGTGSGGMVNTPYVVSILDALREHSEVILNEELAEDTVLYSKLCKAYDKLGYGIPDNRYATWK